MTLTLFKKLKDRGYLNQSTNEVSIKKIMTDQRIIAYTGFDCTAQSLHAGHLMQIMILRLLQQHGHKPIVVVGGATTKIGDPTGKNAIRKYLAEDDIAKNMQGIKESLSKFIKFGNNKTDAIILNNADWLEKISYIEFLRDIGKIFSVNKMLTMDSVKLRLNKEQSLTFLEFNYMLLQAYDFYHLNKKYNCQLQFGGSDQWGNIIMGVDLIHKISHKEVFGLTTPLLTTSSGIKMGKSVSGAVWLNESELSAYHYYQYWRNTEDTNVINFAKLYCEFDNDEFESFRVLSLNDINAAKKILAYKITTLCHGKQKAWNAMKTAQKVFEERSVGSDLPSINVTLTRIKEGIPCLDLFLEAGLGASKGELRRIIRSKGARINNVQIINEHMILNYKHVINGIIKLSVGKKTHVIININ